jgi:hypothetical protein
VRFAETGEEAFVRAADAKTQPGYQHPPFTGQLKQLIADFAAVFQDVLPKTPAQWDDGFRRDLDYEKEIEFLGERRRCISTLHDWKRAESKGHVATCSTSSFPASPMASPWGWNASS